MKTRTRPLDINRPNVVAVIQTLDEARILSTVWPDKASAIELRLDDPSILDGLDVLEEELPHAEVPAIITVRHHSQGGKIKLSTPQRRALYERFMKYAGAIDVEIKFIHEFFDLIKIARELGVHVIGSHHDFRGVPFDEQIFEQYEIASHHKISVFKLAVTANVSDLPGLIRNFLKFSPRTAEDPKLSFMSMGPEVGRLSRLIFAGLGSKLNYGYVERPPDSKKLTPAEKAVLSGQWPVGELKAIINGIRANTKS